MKKHSIVFSRKSNENSDSAPDPVFEVGSREVDMAETMTCCLNYDDNRLVRVNVYEVHEVSLPDFLSVAEWVRNTTAWKFAWQMGVNPEWPEAWQRGLLELESFEQFVCAKLLATKNFRSSFRKSCRDQLVAWLETPVEERRYESPLSSRQMESLTGPQDSRIVEGRSDSAYRSNRYAPNLGV